MLSSTGPRQRRLRPRAVLKWAGAAVSVLLLAAWVVSGWWFVDWGWGPGRVRNRVLLIAGCVYVEHVSAPPLPSPSFGRPSLPGDVILRSRASMHLSAPFWWWQLWPYTVQGPSPGAIPGGGYPAGSFSTEVNIPLWPPFLVAAGLTVACWLRGRRRPVGVCAACKYDLSGLPSGAACPECGEGA